MGAQATDDAEDLYRAAVGEPSADYYVPKFLRFDQPGASKLSWNWAAFFPFVSLFWFFYRRMYGYWAVFCLLIPLGINVCGVIAIATWRNARVLWLVEIAALAYRFVVVPMLANGLYYRHIKRRIGLLRVRVPDPSMHVGVLGNLPHTSPVACAVLAVLLVPIFGLMTAVAIPAYQMYTVRAEVSEDLLLLKPMERAVSDHFRSKGRWPADLADLGMSPPGADDVASIDLSHGTLSMTFGNRANRMIAGTVLSLRPSLLAGSLVWTCGYAQSAGADPWTGAADPSRTDIDARYLPRVCRGSQRPVTTPTEATPAIPPAGAHPVTSPEAAPRPGEAAVTPAAPAIPVDLPDSMAVTRQILRMRNEQMRLLLRSGQTPPAPVFSRCMATIQIDAMGMPGPDYAIDCTDPRAADILRRAIAATGTPRAQPGTTVLLRVMAPFPPS